MIKLTDAESRIARETAYVLHGRPVCIELLNGGIKVWLKGKREAYTVPYDQLFTDGQRGSVKIPARQVSDAKLAKIVSKREQASVRQTICKHCALDIEGVRPFRKGAWRDRGNNATCPGPNYNGLLHAPVAEEA